MCNLIERINTNDFDFLLEVYNQFEKLNMLRYINSGEAVAALKEALEFLK